MHVVALPRCYGSTCRTDEDPELLEEYSFRPTSEALGQAGDLRNTWQCVGMLMDASTVRESVCEVQTSSLRDNTNVQAAYDRMVGATISVLDKGESGAISGIEEYQAVCEATGGMIIQPPIAISCAAKHRRTGLNSLRDKVTFVASNFPLCIGSKCDAVPSDAGILFEQFLKDSGTLDVDEGLEWTCQQDASMDETASFFHKIKLKFQKNPALLYSVCGSLVVSVLLIAACCCCSCGSTSKKPPSSLVKEHGNDNGFQ